MDDDDVAGAAANIEDMDMSEDASDVADSHVPESDIATAAELKDVDRQDDRR